MAAYLVRTIDDHDTVGFFVADKMDDLLVAVDECTDPDSCEYIELRPGGIMWTSPAIAIPRNAGDDEIEEESEKLPWARATLSELWWSVVLGHTDEEWTEFFPGSPQKLKKAPSRPLGPGRVVR